MTFRRLLCFGVITALVAVVVWSSEPRGGGPRPRDVAIASIRPREIARPEPAPHGPAMPPIDDRIAALMAERGIPDGLRAPLAVLGADLRTLREREARAGGRAGLQTEIADERRVLGAKTRDVLAALPPQVRAAMRRHRVSPRQLAEWAADHPVRASR